MRVQDVTFARELLGRAAEEVPVLGEPGGGAQCPLLAVAADADRRVRLRVESFRRLLTESRPLQAEEAGKAAQSGPYTAWAMTLGEIDPLVTGDRRVNRDADGPWGHVPELHPTMAHTLRSATTATSTAPSSSGSGGGGGGGSW